MPSAPARLPVLPPAGLVVELQGLGREDLNGLRGVSLGQTEELRRKCRLGVRLDGGRELSVPAGHATAVAAFEELSGKGVGVVARLPIKAGGLLLRELPVLRGRVGDAPDRQQFRALPLEQQKAVWELCDVYADISGEEKTLEGIMATNALPRAPGSDEGVLCILASRCNHCCAPNAEYLWSEEADCEEIRAVHDISPGEEVCVNYFGDLLRQPRSVRQAHLRDGWRFDCRCPPCLAADPASDERRSRLVRLSEEILTCRERPEEGVRMAEEMLELMQREGISAPRTAAQVCNDGFELAVLMGEQSEVQLWAHMSYEAHRQGWGEDHPMTRRMKHFVQFPPSLAAASGAAAPGAPAPPSVRERTAATRTPRPAAPPPAETAAASAGAAPWLASMD
uniref:SET domain-containing protein n=1 Tax=Alexandrium monilatum TaxID=311494 RepID=A0A7S4VRJ9_9DINO